LNRVKTFKTAGLMSRPLMKKAPSSKRQAERATLRFAIEIPNTTSAAGSIFMNA